MTYTSSLKSQLIDAGYSIIKQENYWTLLDNGELLLQNTSLGDLLFKAAKQFGTE